MNSMFNMFGDGEDFLKRGFTPLRLLVGGDGGKLRDKLPMLRGRRVGKDIKEQKRKVILHT
jgi:hypothetical protein